MARLSILCVFVVFLASDVSQQQNISNDIVRETPPPPTTRSPSKSRTLYDYQTRVVAYKDLIESQCLLEILNGGSESLISKWISEGGKDTPSKIFSIYNQPMSKRQIWHMAGQRITEFCRGFPTYLIKGTATVNKTVDDSAVNDLGENGDFSGLRRRRATRHYFQGRIRGQTQSQYLSFGKTDQPGKAEAESTLEGSKAAVSGSSGIGQAQSQSSPYGCEECYGPGYGPYDQEQTIGFGTGRPGQKTPEFIVQGRPGGYPQPGNGRSSDQLGGGPGPYTGRPGQIEDLEQNGHGRPSGGYDGGRPGDFGQRPSGGPTGYGPPEGPTTAHNGQIVRRPEQIGGGPGSVFGPNQGGGTPSQFVSGPGQVVGGPGQVGGGPGQIIGRPGQIFTGTGQTVGGPGQIIGGPGQIAGGPGQTDGISGQVVGGPGQVGGGPGQIIGRPGQIFTGTGQTVGGPGQIIGGPGQIVGGPGQTNGIPGQIPESTYGRIPNQFPQGPPGQDITKQPLQISGGPSQGIGGPGQMVRPIGPDGYGQPDQNGISRRPITTHGTGGNQMGAVIDLGDSVQRPVQQAGTFGGQQSGDYQSNRGYSGRFSGKFSGEYEGVGPPYSGYARPEGGSQVLGPSGTYYQAPSGTGITYPAGYSGQVVSQGPSNGYHQIYDGNVVPTTSHNGQGTYQYPGGQVIGGDQRGYQPGVEGGQKLPQPYTGQTVSGQHGNGYHDTTRPISSSTGIIQQTGNGGQQPPEQYVGQVTEPYGNGFQGRRISAQPSLQPYYQRPSGPGQNTYQTGTDYLPETGIVPQGRPGLTQPGAHTYSGQNGLNGQGGGREYGVGGNGQYDASLHGGVQPQTGGAGTGGTGQYGGGHYGNGAGQYGGGGSGVQYGPGGGGVQYGPGGGGSQYGPGGGGDQYGGGGGGAQYGVGGGGGQYGGEGGRDQNSAGGGGGDSGGQYGAVGGGAGQYGVGGDGGQYGGGNTGQNIQELDDSDSQVQTSVQQTNNGTHANAQAQGIYGGGTAQSQVSGTYTGSGSFSASAGSDDGKRGAQTQVEGGSYGAKSAAQGRGGVGQSQAQVVLSSETGDTLSSAQTGGFNHGTQTQVHASEKGGMADAQANGPGSTSSQAQIGFTPYDENDDDNQTTPFRGGGMAGAQSGSHSGMTQSQIQGKFLYGIKYTGGAQAGSGGTGFGKNYTIRPGPFKPVDLTFYPERDDSASSQKQTQTQRLDIHENTNSTIDPVENDTENEQENEHETTPENEPDDVRDAENKQYGGDDGDDYTESGEEGDYDTATESPATRSIITQSSKNQRQHIVLDPLEDLDVTIHQSKGDFPEDGAILQPGQVIPGTPGFKIPSGFRGTVKSISNGRNTYAIGKNSQAQSVTLSPGTGRIIYRRPVYAVSSNTHYRNGQYGYGSGYTYQPAYRPVQYLLKNGKVLPNFVSVTKSETGSKNLYTGQKIPRVYYSQSSSCGIFTNHCVLNGGKRMCFPKAKTNPDGTIMGC